MNMKQKLPLISIAAAIALALSACDTAPAHEVVIGVRAGLGGSGSRSVSPGDRVTDVSSYRVGFRKIEIGNSESDKYVLWEDAAGQVKDVAATVGFEGVRAIPAGSYKFIRLTISDSLSLDGSIDDAGTVYYGTGTVALDDTTYLWGSVFEGASALEGEIEIGEGSILSFSFDIADTVSYLGGPADAASLGVEKPSLSVAVR